MATTDGTRPDFSGFHEDSRRTRIRRHRGRLAYFINSIWRARLMAVVSRRW